MSTFSPGIMATLGQFINAAAPELGGKSPMAVAPPDAMASAVPAVPAVPQDTSTMLGQVRSLPDAAAVASYGSQESRAALGDVGANINGMLQGAGQNQKFANQAGVAADLQQADAVAPLFADFHKQLDAREQDFLQRQTEGQQRAANAYDDYLRTATDFGQSRVYNWWSEASTGAKVLGIISQTLSGALAGATGNPGSPSPMDRIIENDLARQKANIAIKGQAADAAGNLYAQLKKQLGDDVSAEAAFRDVARQSVKARAEALIASMPEAQQAKAAANLLKLNAEVDTKTAEERAKHQQKLLETETQRNWQDSHLAVQLATSFGTEAMSQMNSSAARSSAVGITDIPGSEHLDPPQKAALKTQYDATQRATGALDRIKALLQARTNNDSTEVRQALQSAISDFTVTYNEIAKLGALSKGDAAFINDITNINTGLLGSVGNKLGKAGLPLDTFENGLKRVDTAKHILEGNLHKVVGSFSLHGEPLRWVRGGR